MSEKTERWAWQRIQELEEERRRLVHRLGAMTRSRELWRHRALVRQKTSRRET